MGVNAYAVPAATCLGGPPEIESGATTRIENAGRLLVCVPSLTLITMPEDVPV